MKKIDGQEVVNAATGLRLTVTSADIAKGAPKNPNACALALAAVRQIKGATAARVHLSCIYVNVHRQWKRWRTPEYATRDIVAFDRGGRFVPGEYDLLPIPVSQLTRRVAQIRNGGVPVSAARRRPAKPRPRHHTADVRESAHADQPPGLRVIRGGKAAAA